MSDDVRHKDISFALGGAVLDRVLSCPEYLSARCFSDGVKDDMLDWLRSLTVQALSSEVKFDSRQAAAA
ncbi:hypothetical protein ACX80U_11390 [Arthrobacter sp. TmT3-37]